MKIYLNNYYLSYFIIIYPSQLSSNIEQPLPTLKPFHYIISVQLRSTDESWRAAARERDTWKSKYETAEKRSFAFEKQAHEAIGQVATAQEKAREALRQLGATKAAAEQQNKALDAATIENVALKTQAADLQRALSDAQQSTNKEKDLRMGLQEQNTLLQFKITEALNDEGRIQGELQSLQTTLKAAQTHFEAETTRFQVEISTSKTATLGVQRHLEASKQRIVSLESEIESLKQAATRQTSRIQRLEEDKRCAEESKEHAEREISKLRDEKQRMLREYDAQRRQLESEIGCITSALQRLNASSSRPPGC